MIRGMDRFLAAILAALLVIVVVAIVLVWRSPTGTELEYRAGVDPEDIVHNYVVAIAKGDVTRAKSYFSPELLADIEEREKDGFTLTSPSSRPGDTGRRIVVDLRGIDDGLATVEAKITRFHSDPAPIGLFSIFDDNQWSSNSQVRLRQFDGEWKIVKPFDTYIFY